MTTPDRQVANLSLTQLTEHILSLHHRYLREALSALAFQLTLVECHFESPPPDLSESFSAICATLCGLLDRDRDVLFPRLVRLEDPGATADPEKLGTILRWISQDYARLGTELTRFRARLYELRQFSRLKQLQRGLADLQEDLRERSVLQDEVLYDRVLQRARQLNAG